MLLEIITPEKIIYKEEADEVIVPTQEGEIGILPGHVGLLSKLVPGEITIKKNGKSHLIAVMGGFLEISKDTISILADYAIRAENIETAKVEQAKKRAENTMKEKATEKDFKIAEAEIIKSVLQLKVANRYRKRI